MAPNAFSHPSLAASATDWIADRILQGGILPGEKLTETSLADMMGISRSPVREALRELSRGGLITIEPRRGAFVAELDDRHAADLYVCRLMLEPSCVAQSVAAMDDRLRAELENMFAVMKRTVDERDAAGYVSALKAYNWALLNGCPNRTLFGFAETSWRSSLRYWDLLMRGSANYLPQSLRRNRTVHAAVRTADPARAETAEAAVLEYGRDQLAKLLKRYRPAGESTVAPAAPETDNNG
jgi:DNA-binding GntR family transcriptional regulator